jgi:hypothetical protein
MCDKLGPKNKESPGLAQITDKFRALIIELVIFTARKEWD